MQTAIKIYAGPGLLVRGEQIERDHWRDGRTHCKTSFRASFSLPFTRALSGSALGSAQIDYDSSRPAGARFGLVATTVGGVSFADMVYLQTRFGAQTRYGEETSYRNVDTLPCPIVLDGDGRGATVYGWTLVDNLDGATFQAITDAELNVPDWPWSIYADTSDWLRTTKETITWRRVE